MNLRPALLGMLGALLASGCASHDEATPEPKPGDGIAQYRSMAVEAERAIQQSLGVLGTLGAQSNKCSPEVVAALSDSVHRLQVDSVGVRARSEAMQARGDAYFERWHENMAKVKDARMRSLAEARRPELERSFRRIKSLSGEGREAFNGYLANFRRLRNSLEKDASIVTEPATRELTRTCVAQGQQVKQRIEGVVRELDAMRAMVTPAGAATTRR